MTTGGTGLAVALMRLRVLFSEVVSAFSADILTWVLLRDISCWLTVSASMRDLPDSLSLMVLPSWPQGYCTDKQKNLSSGVYFLTFVLCGVERKIC